MKPIETVYRDYRFRSRLEARWAVFFDTLGVRWEYEKEGYDLDGVYYLPDFWLPDHQCWIEIKGVETPDSIVKVKRLAMHANRLVFVFYNCQLPEIRPASNDVYGCVIENYGRYYAPDGEWDGMQAFGVCSVCNEVTLGNKGSHWVYCNAMYELYTGNCTGWHEGLPIEDRHPRIIDAYRAAKQARFEHGERP